MSDNEQKVLLLLYTRNKLLGRRNLVVLLDVIN